MQLPGVTVLRAVCSVVALTTSVVAAPTALAILEALIRSTDVVRVTPHGRLDSMV
jgi:hypothetical protein